MKSITPMVLLLALMMLMPWASMAQARSGKITGGSTYAIPQWFKESFLEFGSDVQEAKGQGKHVMVFLHLDQCPYCAMTIRENFLSGETREFTERNFDAIAINIRGDLEVKWIDGETYTEQALKAVATPTIVFLDQDGEKALQLTGYRDPRALRLALDYVQSRQYLQQPFASYVAGRKRPDVYRFRDHELFTNATYFKDYDKPLAILFEESSCSDCDRFHETTLSRTDVKEEMGKYLFVRLDAGSTRPVIDPAGKRTSPAEWVEMLGLSYRPALALFNEGRLIYRIDGRLFHFHLREALNYVSGRNYGKYDSLSGYRAAYRAKLLEEGKDIDFDE
jgi:thioredoxin-related protein